MQVSMGHHLNLGGVMVLGLHGEDLILELSVVEVIVSPAPDSHQAGAVGHEAVSPGEHRGQVYPQPHLGLASESVEVIPTNICQGRITNEDGQQVIETL